MEGRRIVIMRVVLMGRLWLLRRGIGLLLLGPSIRIRIECRGVRSGRNGRLERGVGGG